MLASAAGLTLAPLAHAQVEDDASHTPVDSARTVVAGFSLGAHDFGLLIGARLNPWLSLAARLEGVGIATRRVVAIGPRIDPVTDRYLRIYLLPMFGGVACAPGWSGEVVNCRDRSLHAGLGLLGGGEFYMDDSGSFSLGFEAGYWWVFDDPDIARAKLSHATIAAMLRLRT